MVFELSFTEWFGVELVYEAEYDGEEKKTGWDEAFIYFDFDGVGIGVELGRGLCFRFGEYYSHFCKLDHCWSLVKLFVMG